MTAHTRSIALSGRTLSVETSDAVEAALAAGSAPKVIELELYFSCLIRKRVRFLDAPHPDAQCVQIDDRFSVCFRPVMTRACAVQDVEGAPELESFPIRRPEAFVPRWLRIDQRRGVWTGEFGY